MKYGFLDRFCCTDHSICLDLAKIGRLNFQIPCLHKNLHPLHLIVNHSADTIAQGRCQNKKSGNIIHSFPKLLCIILGGGGGGVNQQTDRGVPFWLLKWYPKI